MRSGAQEGCVIRITRPVLLQAAPAPRVPIINPSGLKSRQTSMPGTAVLLQSSDKDLKNCTWTYREKKTEKSGSKATLFLPSGEKYCGSWQHNKREGGGTVVYPDKDKYEGEWLNGKRHGTGALWLYDSDRYRICYTGEWQRDKFHGRGIYYDDAGNAYEGLWEKGLRKGCGQQAYLSEPGNSSDVYDGDWELDNRSGTGTMRYANGDVFEGQWANDMKNGPGVYYYADGAVYEGFWQEDIAKCGCYRQATESEEQQPGALPALQLENAQLVLADAEDSLPPMVYY